MGFEQIEKLERWPIFGLSGRAALQSSNKTEPATLLPAPVGLMARRRRTPRRGLRLVFRKTGKKCDLAGTLARRIRIKT